MQKINNLNEKLVEIYGKMVKIEDHLDTMDAENVESEPTNKHNTEKSIDKGKVQASKRTNK